MPTALQSGLADLAAEGRKQPFDVIVVGAGSAGLTTACTLAQAQKRVVMFEAGPAPFLTHITNTDLRFAPELGRNLRNAVQYSPDLKSGGKFGTNFGCFGGRGLFWNGATPRYSEADFQSWPLAAADLEDVYAWAETQFRVSRRTGETELAGRMIAKLKTAGFAAEPCPFAVDDTAPTHGRLNAGIASGLGLFFRGVGDAVAAGRLKVATNSMVQRVLLSGSKVRGVTVSAAGTAAEISSSAVVLAGGGIESIKLAALSGVDDPHGRIGKGLQEHLFYHGLFSGPELYDPSRADAAIVYIRSSPQKAHQWELHAPGERLFSVDDGTAWRPNGERPYQIMARSFAATEKRDDNMVEPRDGPLGSSLIHFTHSAADEVVKDRVIEDALRLTAALGLKATDAAGTGSRTRFRGPGNSYHEAGGLDMGRDPKSSVTYPDGRFHTVPDLIAADAAAFPRIGAANPHLTIVAVARRKALALAERLK
jgi:choline dehydrogenase-like flavoprotein